MYEYKKYKRQERIDYLEREIETGKREVEMIDRYLELCERNPDCN